jgi:hypothetical protein
VFLFLGGRMVRGTAVGAGTALLLLLQPGLAFACDTSSWLDVPGPVQPGSVATLHGGGLEPGPVALVWDRSTGAVVGEGTVAADGRLATSVRIPADAVGAHKVIALTAAGQVSPTHSHAWVALHLPVAAGGLSPAVVPTEGDEAAEWPLRAEGAGFAVLTAAVLALVWRRRGSDSDDDLDVELRLLVEQAGSRPPAAPQ